MSLVDGISGALGNRTTIGGTDQRRTLGTGSTPGSPTAAQGLATRFGTVIQTTFSTSMATVYEKGAKGGFDDPTIALELAAAEERFRRAQQGLGPTPGATPTSSTGVPAPVGERGPGTGADAAPTTTGSIGGGPADGAITPVATIPVAAPGGVGTASVVTQQRELYALRVRQSEARVANISASLQADYPAAARLPSASTGWDPEAFVPKTREEAEAFAQRMVIDATESAAHLELVKTKLDAASLEAQTTGSPAAKAQVEQLTAAFERQKTYVDKLARIVDTAAGGAVTVKGSAVLHGATMRDDGDIPIAEMVKALRDAGMTDGQIARTVGATELGVEQERTPGGSATLKTVAKASADWTYKHRDNLQQARRISEQRIEDDRREAEAEDDRRFQKNLEKRRTAKREFLANLDERASKRNALDEAQFEAYLAKVAARQDQLRAG